ncbi:oligopeptide ABC transporter substrate-binding protein [Bacillus sp. FJAT-49736]|uniref:oligopeptide ABC transporter substrate-binding protein n=1 Tax=Bacillus sp. FJAT-49736 TaxID=2833582 RepID=UPI001BC9BBDF|nr:oligopeptide ABC transporter substrate-binding protein [Bacillus sp. FJAT-49736]MBS4175476.1 oligopeptide ABC transporter substrate-binding protein [Bacillus sp. FJAT-49736]
MKKNHLLKILSLIVVLGLLLSACSSSTGGNGSKKKSEPGKPAVDTSKFPMQVKNDKTEVQDGTLTYALLSNTPFEGTLDYAFYTGQPDSEVLQFFSEPLFWSNSDYEFTNDGPASYTLSDDNKTFTVKIKDNVNWSDGKPVTAEDYKYSFQVIGSPDYTGVRYGDDLIQSIVGMKEYHAGKAKDISGIKIIDEKTISFTFTKPSPALITGFWPYAMPKHYLGDIPIKDLAKSDKIHKTPIGFGPFKIKKIVPGESVEYVRNDDYYAGKPKLKSIILKVVNPKVVLQSLKKGEVDIASFPADQYPAAKNAKAFQFVGKTALSYSYIGFKLGHWDAKKGENVMDNPKFADKKLRQAMAYAIDFKSIGEKIYNGLKFPATGLIPPSFATWYDKDSNPATFDPEKAKKLLDEAGYKDKDGDGLREDPKGNKFHINFLAMSGSETAEPLAKFYIQSWKNVGLDVSLVDGRLAEFNSFYKMVEEDDPKVDIFAAGWNTGTDVDPYGLYGKNVPFNYVHFVSDKNDQLLEDGHSEAAFDKEYRKKVYNEWQTYMNDEMPLIPGLFSYSLTAVNNRVKDYSLDPVKGNTIWRDVTVTSDTPDAE